VYSTKIGDDLKAFHLLVLDLLLETLKSSGCYGEAVDLTKMIIREFRGLPLMGAFEEELDECKELLDEWVCQDPTASGLARRMMERCGLYCRASYPWMGVEHSRSVKLPYATVGK
jgi:hypothetical protein